MERTRILLAAESPLLAKLAQEELERDGRVHVTMHPDGWAALLTWAADASREEVAAALYVGASPVTPVSWHETAAGRRSPLVVVDTIGAIGVQHAIELGARGYVAPDEAPREMVERVLGAARGAPALPPDALPRLRAALRLGTREDLRSRGLEPADEQMLRWLASGTPVKEIAARLGCTRSAAYARLGRLRARLGIQTQSEMATLAAEAGLFGDPQAARSEDASP